ncbi:MAG: LamG domain-containing protein [Candidatus Sungiibacteriota bacterium]|uniref:LamG domain-containing protein n=1 Tax=Candidatus Sungiibacteriota bacterium TaxID=2750080 RepID=A0A7T5RJ88_9BACT|nr:MAG: LamG domain-containing protein [Candidatus Sungbacteria bacterium]
MNTLFQKNILISGAILVFSLLVGSYIIFAPGKNVFAQKFTEERRVPLQFDFVSQWNGGEESGGTAIDIGRGNNGTIRKGVAVAPGRFGQAFKFRVGSSISMGNPESLNFGTGPFSLNAWFKWDGGGSINNIIRKSNYPTKGPGAGYWLRIGTSEGKSTLEFSVGATTGPEGQSLITTPVSSGVWHYVVATRDSSDAIKLYVDGESKGTVIRKASKAETTSEAQFTLGAWDDRFGRREFFSGLIEEVAVYNRALTSSEVQSAYKELRQILAAKDSGVPFPGNCNTRYRCLRYCEAPANALACVDFAEAAGFISKDEAQQARKYIPLILQGVTPGKCDTKERCEAYCQDPAHTLECMEFAVKYEVLPKNELEVLKKILPFMRAGKMPGGCRSKAECESYCTDTAHFEECLDLGLALGVIKPEEVELIRKSGGKGPGNCRSKEACETYCTKPENQKACMDFAVKIGLMTQEEVDQAQAAGDVRQCFEEADEKIVSCFVTNLGTDLFEQMRAGKMPYDIAIIEKIRKAKSCVKQYSDQATDVLGDFLKALPAADSCVAAEFGPDFIGRLRRMAVPCSQMKGIRGKMEACFLQGTNALFEPCAQKECGQVQSCMLEVAKPLMSIAKRVEASDPARSQKRELPKVMQDKLLSCGIDPNFDPNTCISKSTCTEFFSCLNPSGSQQQGDQPGEMPPELKTRVDSCMKEIVDIKMRECTSKPTCSEVNICLKAQMSEGASKGDKDMGKKIELPLDVESRLMVCQQEEIQAKLDVCVAKSCSEFDACINSLQEGGEKQDGQQQKQGESDPKIKAKVQACVDEKINACIAKPCGEFTACVSALQGSAGGGEQQQQQQQGQSNPAIEAKMKSCQSKGGSGGAPPDGRGQQPPQGFQPPSGFSQPPASYPSGSSSEIPITPELCANFTNIPACSYVGSPDSQNYQLCKKCYPDK